MTTIKLHNTRTRTKEDFVPIDADNVRMYVCGPTVYDRAHLGNARPVVVFDVLFRLLRHVYGADHVTYVRNFTDVDDKINATALARKQAGAEGSLEQLVQERSDETIGWYLHDMGALGALEPTEMPRATQYIPQMIAMIETLIERGFAYTARDGSNNPPQEYVIADREATYSEVAHALFEVQKYDDYGKLSGRSVDDMIAGARVEIAPYKKNPMDFVLWKPSTDELPGWDSPWGRGRPGWHIECSAMAYELLGESFDIHGGGNDLMFPHHENEIAQSCCAHPQGEFARVWMHNEMLQVEGKKMSKSLGNFFTVHDLLEQGVPGEVIRFVFLQTHYRKPMDWTEKKAREAKKTLTKWSEFNGAIGPELDSSAQPDSKVLEALADDLNTHKAITRMHELFQETKRDASAKHTFGASLRLLGFGKLMSSSFKELVVTSLSENKLKAEAPEAYAALTSCFGKWEAAVIAKDFSTADRLREKLHDAGVTTRTTVDKETGKKLFEYDLDTDSVDVSKLEAL